MYTIVLLTEDTLTAHDVARVAHLHDPEPVSVHVLVPVAGHHSAVVEALDDVALGRLREALDDESEPTDQAQSDAVAALDASVAALTAAGVTATGTVSTGDPVAATVARAGAVDADEVLVVTPPHLLEETFRRDWASKLRSRLDRPVLHVVAGTDRVVS